MGVINPRAVPEHITAFQAGYIEKAVLSYFADPVHRKEFESWKREREKHEKVVKSGLHDCSSMGGGSAGMVVGA